MLWEIFLSTGKIEDYLEYKRSAEAEQNADIERLDNTRRAKGRKQ